MIALDLTIDRRSGAGIPLSIPWTTLGIVRVLGVVLGFPASRIPARRSARLEALDAVNAT